MTSSTLMSMYRMLEKTSLSSKNLSEHKLSSTSLSKVSMKNRAISMMLVSGSLKSALGNYQMRISKLLGTCKIL
jgi:hypothetical protein